jgi:hypothetical protein
MPDLHLDATSTINAKRVPKVLLTNSSAQKSITIRPLTAPLRKIAGAHTIKEQLLTLPNRNEAFRVRYFAPG